MPSCKTRNCAPTEASDEEQAPKETTAVLAHALAPTLPPLDRESRNAGRKQQPEKRETDDGKRKTEQQSRVPNKGVAAVTALPRRTSTASTGRFSGKTSDQGENTVQYGTSTSTHLKKGNAVPVGPAGAGVMHCGCRRTRRSSGPQGGVESQREKLVGVGKKPGRTRETDWLELLMEQ